MKTENIIQERKPKRKVSQPIKALFTLLSYLIILVILWGLIELGVFLYELV